MQEIRRLDLRWWRHLRRELEIEKIIPEIYLLLSQEFIESGRWYVDIYSR